MSMDSGGQPAPPINTNITNLSTKGTIQSALENLSENSVRIKNKLFTNNRNETSGEELQYLLDELKELRNLYPFNKEVTSLIHRVRRQINKISYYEQASFPPFLTIIEHYCRDIHPMNLAKILHNNEVKGVKNVEKKGKKKVGITFNTPFEANDFIDKNPLKEQGYKAFIPDRMLCSRGIVRHIGDEITEEDFINHGYGIRGSQKAKILDATRFNRKTIVEGQEKLVPGTTFMLLFAGKMPPTEVNLFHSKRSVFPYINPVILCYKCLKFGHNSSQCRNKSRCFDCGEDHPQEDCNSSKGISSCPNCKGKHKVNSKECEEYKRQRQINEAIANHNISFFEANKMFPKISEVSNENTGSNNNNTQLTFSNFPNTLQVEVTQTNQNKHRHISSRPTYSSQVAKKPKLPRVSSPNFDSQKHRELTFPDPTRMTSFPGSLLTQTSEANNTQEPQNSELELTEDLSMEEDIIDCSQAKEAFNNLKNEKAIVDNIIGTQSSTNSSVVHSDVERFLKNLTKRK